MSFVDKHLNRITMYSLLLYGLSILAVLSIVGSFFGLIRFSALSLLESLAILLIISQGSNYLMAKLFKSPRNIESAYISALILFFVILPGIQSGNLYILIVAPLIAMLAKYLLAIGGKHLFNPVAISIFILDLLGNGPGVWWITNPFMILPLVILGLLVVRKIRRFDLFIPFALTSLLIIVIREYQSLGDIPGLIFQTFLSWPIIFLGTIMLTEPLTTPPQRKMRIVYSIIVGLLFSLQFHFGRIDATPEFALVIGNIFSYLVSPKRKFRLRFLSKEKISAHVYGFSFRPNKPLDYKPGQYLEWTIPNVPYDLRGNRRYFTISSSPTEPEIKLGVRIEEKDGSNFKQKLLSLKPDDVIVASQLAGEFTLPKDQKEKLVFIAGGIGITPFRSMIKYLADKNKRRDILLFYAASTEEDFSFKNELEELKDKVGAKIIYLSGNRITEEILKEEVPDFKERYFFLSGPNAMVESYKKLLIDLGISRHQISTDYFPGF